MAIESPEEDRPWHGGGIVVRDPAGDDYVVTFSFDAEQCKNAKQISVADILSDVRVQREQRRIARDGELLFPEPEHLLSLVDEIAHADEMVVGASNNTSLPLPATDTRPITAWQRADLRLVCRFCHRLDLVRMLSPLLLEHSFDQFFAILPQTPEQNFGGGQRGGPNAEQNNPSNRQQRGTAGFLAVLKDAFAGAKNPNAANENQPSDRAAADSPAPSQTGRAPVAGDEPTLPSSRDWRTAVYQLICSGADRCAEELALLNDPRRGLFAKLVLLLNFMHHQSRKGLIQVCCNKVKLSPCNDSMIHANTPPSPSLLPVRRGAPSVSGGRSPRSKGAPKARWGKGRGLMQAALSL